MSLVRQYIREVLEAVPQIQPQSQIFCDMDGVLVDFQSAAIAAVNSLLDGQQPRHSSMTSKNARRLQVIKDEKGDKWRASTSADLKLKAVRNLMFGVMGMSPGNFYAEMDPNPDGITELWPFLNSTGHQVNLLSAPIGTSTTDGMTSEEGKRLWAEQLDPAPSEIIITPAIHKPRYAMTNGIPNILIDDRLSTVDAWNAAGGIAVLHIPKQSGGTILQLKGLGL